MNLRKLKDDCESKFLKTKIQTQMTMSNYLSIHLSFCLKTQSKDTTTNVMFCILNLRCKTSHDVWFFFHIGYALARD